MRGTNVFFLSLLQHAAGAKLSQEVSPIRKIVNLLQDMSKQLEEEGKKDEETMQKLECWCKTTKKEKEAAVKAADAETDKLSAEINGEAGAGGKLTANIAQGEKDLAEASTGLKKAEELRKKEAASFSKNDEELSLGLQNLKNAINVLEKVQGGFLQMTPELKAGLTAVLHDASKMTELRNLKAPAISKVSFLQAPASEVAFLQAVSGHGETPVLSAKSAGRLLTSFLAQKETASRPVNKYNAQSGGVVGVLKGMQDDFEQNLKDAREEEATRVESFNKLRAAKQREIAAGEKQLAANKEAATEAKFAGANAKETLDQTRKQRAADVEFLSNLNVQCKGNESQFATRQKERAEEMKAVHEAIEILNSDDNRDLMSKTVKFVQVRAESQSLSKREQASRVLSRAAAAVPNWEDLGFNWSAMGGAKSPKKELATLAVSAKLDAFTKVKAAMDKLASDIQTQIKADVDAKDQCNEDIAENGTAMQETSREAKLQNNKVNSLGEDIEELQEGIKDATKELNETMKSIKEAGEERDEQSAEYQTTVTEQRATQAVLQKAIDKLKGYYEKKDAEVKKAALLQADQQPPVQFETYNKQSGSVSVLAMLDKVFTDSKAIEEEATKDENEAQAQYAQFVKDANASAASLQEAITSKTDTSETKAVEKSETEQELLNTEQRVDELDSEGKMLNKQCKFLLENFELRQQAMRQEIEAIKEAKSILSGMQ